jgi:flavin reductase (DIM6/NTAB) family NADH-FMN oxidoreductase RutF
MNSPSGELAFTPQSTAVVAQEFRLSMRRLASTVCVVTTMTAEGPVGMTMTSVTSVALDPPTLLICVNRSTRLGGVLRAGRMFCVNLLRASQHREAAAFGGAVSAGERFSVGRWNCEADFPPCLEDAQANILCSVEEGGRAAVGTHLVLVGRVLRVSISGEVAPLLYTDGRYTSLGAGSVGF